MNEILKAMSLQLAFFWIKEKVFSTGSKGFTSGGKFVSYDGKKYQVMIQIVEIHSK